MVFKKTINPMATNKKIDKIYDLAKEAGAVVENIGSWTKWIPSYISNLLTNLFYKLNSKRLIYTIK